MGRDGEGGVNMSAPYSIIASQTISGMIRFVSNPIIERENRGAYEQPFSGVGVEFDPLGVNPDRQGVTLHETGFIEANARWNFPGVFSRFWRFHYNGSRGQRSYPDAVLAAQRNWHYPL